jgi:hypothetical protein
LCLNFPSAQNSSQNATAVDATVEVEPPICAFPGVSCEGWSITELLLPGQQLLLPSIPPELSALDTLRSLDLSDNGIGGRLSPLLLSRLPRQLAGLSLAYNQFTGGLPSTMSRLTALRVLNLAHNELEGPVPRWWASLRQLALLDLSRNRLFGPLPDELDAIADSIRVVRPLISFHLLFMFFIDTESK